MIRLLKNSSIQNILLYIFAFVPLIIFTSKFLSDLFLTIIAIYVIFSAIYDKSKIKYLSFFFIFVFYIFLNSLVQVNDLTKNFKSLALIRFPLYILFPYYINYNNINIYFVRNIRIIFYFIIFIFCFDIMYQSFFLKNIIGYPADISYQRISGFFKDELVAGAYLFFIFFIIIFLYESHKKINYFFLYFLILIYICIFISGDRTPFLMLNFFLFVYSIYNLKFLIINYKKVLHVFFTLFFIGVFFSNISDYSPIQKYKRTILEISNDLNNSKDTSEFSFKRWNYFGMTVKSYLIFLSNPIFGTSYKTYSEECKNMKYDDDFYKITMLDRDNNGCEIHPHNFYMQILSEQGIFGLLLIILLIYQLILLGKVAFSKNYKMIYSFFVLVYFFPLKPTGSIYTNFNLILLCSAISFFVFISLYKKQN